MRRAIILLLVADSVILLFRLDATRPPRRLRARSTRIPLACCLVLSCVLAVDTRIFYFSSLPSLFSISNLDIVCFILSFSCG